jgi:hypothetical protein
MRSIGASLSVALLMGVIGCTAAIAGDATANAQTQVTDNLPTMRYSTGTMSPNMIKIPAAFDQIMASQPRPRNCEALITRPASDFNPAPMQHWYTTGTEDIGQVLNTVLASMQRTGEVGNDLQIRIEKVRCEQANIEDKLDFLTKLQIYQIQHAAAPAQ